MLNADTCWETCADGFITSGEVCDDNNTINLDGCNSACTVETGWTCTPAFVSTCRGICGDGMVKPGEICDDGGTDNSTDCLANCMGPAPGYSCSSGSPTSPSICF